MILVGLIPSLSKAETPSGFVCKAYDHQSGKWQKVLAADFGSGPGGSAVTKIATAQGVLSFFSDYLQSKTPHYRWGYAHRFETMLTKNGSLFGKVRIDIEYAYQGPGDDGFHFRGITGHLELANGDNAEMKYIHLSCKATN
jgi:hypothetical protein